MTNFNYNEIQSIAIKTNIHRGMSVDSIKKALRQFLGAYTLLKTLDDDYLLDCLSDRAYDGFYFQLDAMEEYIGAIGEAVLSGVPDYNKTVEDCRWCDVSLGKALAILGNYDIRVDF